MQKLYFAPDIFALYSGLLKAFLSQNSPSLSFLQTRISIFASNPTFTATLSAIVVFDECTKFSEDLEFNKIRPTCVKLLPKRLFLFSIIVEYLIGKDADVNAKDEDESTPLHLAVL